MRARFAEIFRSRTREAWCTIFAGTDACVTPVLDREEVADAPHVVARQTMIDVGGIAQPAPAPRFTGTPTRQPTPPVKDGANSREVLRESGFSAAEIEGLLAERVVYEVQA